MLYKGLNKGLAYIRKQELETVIAAFLKMLVPYNKIITYALGATGVLYNSFAYTCAFYVLQHFFWQAV